MKRIGHNNAYAADDVDTLFFIQKKLNLSTSSNVIIKYNVIRSICERALHPP